MCSLYRSVICVLLVLVLTATPLQCRQLSFSDKLHFHLTRTELLRIFTVESYGEVPDYELIKLAPLVVKRDVSSQLYSKSIKFKAFGKYISLNLIRNTDLDEPPHTLVLKKRGNSSEISMERVRDQGDIGQLYQDEENNAALLFHKNEFNEIEVSGTVGEFVIVKVPRRLAEIARKASLPQSIERNLTRNTGTISEMSFYFLYSMKNTHANLDKYFDQGMIKSRVNNSENLAADLKHFSRIQKRSVPDLYPELLLLVDFDTFLVHGADITETKRYIVNFVNAMDLRYRKTKYLSIKIKISDIIIATDEDSTPYISQNMVGSRSFDAVATLNSFSEYMYSHQELPSYDAAILITKLDLCTTSSSGVCNELTAGYAYVGGGCGVSDFYRKVNSVAITEDSGGFSGVIVACHELGHLIGAVHDGSDSLYYLGGPGASTCSWSEGFIMSDLRRDRKGLQWSVCSLDQFVHFARDSRSGCMKNNPVKRSNPNRFTLPGRLFDLDEQCRRDNGGTACFKDARVCTNLFCYDNVTNNCVAFRPAAEGSFCGRGKHCVHGRCLSNRYYY